MHRCPGRAIHVDAPSSTSRDDRRAMTRVKASLASLVTRDERARRTRWVARRGVATNRWDHYNHRRRLRGRARRNRSSENEGEKEGETLCETTEEVSSRANRRRGADAGA